jgi:LPXTG-motif cell wall-anchored protein
MHHTGRLFLDESSMEEVDASLFQLAANDVNPGDTETPASNDEKTATDQTEVKNPQTGEKSNLLLLVMLLIGSGLSLAFMMKRRFAQN